MIFALVKTLLIVLPLLLLGCAAPRPQSALPITDLEQGSAQLIGRLDLPLGTICTIEAVIVEVPSKMRTLGDMGRHYGLRIEKVDGKSPGRPVVSRFEIHLGAPLVRLAPNDLALDQLISRMSQPGQFWALTEEGYLVEAAPVPSEEAEGLRVGYVGSRHTLLVYETADYRGAPKEIPEGYGFVFAHPHEFHFSAHIVVFAELKAKLAQPDI